MRYRISLLTFGCWALLAGALSGGADSGSSEASKEAPAQELIDRLNSRDFKTREAASRALIERQGVLPALRKALHSEHPEVRRRASFIIQEKEARAAKLRLQRLPELLKKGEIDSTIDSLYSLRETLDQKTWELIEDFARRVVEAHAKKYRNPVWYPAPLRKENKYPYRYRRLEDLSGTKYLNSHRSIASQYTQFDDLHTCFLVSQGLVKATGGLGSIIFANGDVTFTGREGILGGLVICDGSIKSENSAGSVLIATGSIEGDRYTERFPNAREAFGVVKFFDLQQVGIEVETAKDAILVKKVLADTPLARAGVQAGDRIISLDGEKVHSADQFRRLVRRKAALIDEALLSVERPGKPIMELTVCLPD